MTQTDIPPGGEGEIEVTFDSNHKKGKQEKTITVESNDPANPKSTLRVSVLIEVEFNFETSSLNLGRIRKGESVTKTAVLLVRNPSKRSLLRLNSRSSHITARTVGSSGGDEGRITVEVTVKPDIPVGKLNATIVAELSDGSHPAANLRISGSVIGNVEVSPETVRFTVDSSRAAQDQAEQMVTISGTEGGTAFRVLGVEDAQNLIAFDIDTLAVGQRYSVSARPNANALNLGRSTAGEMRIRTDDSEQPEISVRYSISIVP